MYAQEFVNGIRYYRTWSPFAKSVKPRILIMNLGHIGDFWMSLPALRHARAIYANAHITLVVSSWNLSVAVQCGVSDECQALDYFPEQSKTGAGTRALQDDVARKALSFGAFDIAIDIRVPDDTRFILEAIKADKKFSFYKSQRGLFDYSLPQPPLSVRIKRKYRILSKLGFRRKENKIRKQFWSTMNHCSANAMGIINHAYVNSGIFENTTSLFVQPEEGGDSISKNLRTISVVPFSNSALRDWPFERYRELISLLLEKTDAQINLVCNGKSLRVHEIGAVDGLRDDLAANPRFAVKDSLSKDEFFAQLSRSCLVISNNSGAGHVSAQLGVPTVGIYTASHIPDVWGFVGPRVSMLSADVACAACGLDFDESKCPNELRCRSAISVEMVFEEARHLLRQFDGKAEQHPGRAD